MRSSLCALTLAALGLLSLPTAIASPAVARSSSSIIAQYWPTYKSNIQNPSQFPWSSTNIAYFFVVSTTPSGLDTTSEADAQSFVNQAHAHNVKAAVSIGGWGGGIYFSNLVATPDSRKTFAGTIKTFITKYGFDGVDLDWEFPGSQGIGCNTISDNDAANYLAFLQILRRSLGTSKLITAAVSSAGFLDPNGKPLQSVTNFKNYLNYINLMTYDISGTWMSTTGPNSPLQTCGASGSVAAAVKIWTDGGFPASKILVGIPSYAISWTTKGGLKAYSGSYLFQPVTSVIPKGDSTDTHNNPPDECGNANSQYSGQWTYSTLISGGSWAAANGLAGVFIFDSAGYTPDVLAAIRKAM